MNPLLTGTEALVRSWFHTYSKSKKVYGTQRDKTITLSAVAES